MKSRFLKSYCKLNLFLNVGRKIKKYNLHDIKSLVFIINLHDEIKIKRVFKPKDSIKFSGSFGNHVNKKENSILQSISLLRRNGYINGNYHVAVKKKIPVFSGLGGGSSNSAAIIKHFLKTKKLSHKTLSYFSKKLGSDLKLFFYSSQFLQKNLTKIQDIKKKHELYFVIVYPFLKCSTKEIYSKYNFVKAEKKQINYNFNSKIKLINSLKVTQNSLEKIAIKKFPLIQKILNELELTKNCHFSRLTGSGSACFGVFLTKKSAQLGLKKIKKKFPKYWCVISKTI